MNTDGDICIIQRLFKAIKNGDLDTCRRCLSEGADVNKSHVSIKK